MTAVSHTVIKRGIVCSVFVFDTIIHTDILSSKSNIKGLILNSFNCQYHKLVFDERKIHEWIGVFDVLPGCATIKIIASLWTVVSKNPQVHCHANDVTNFLDQVPFHASGVWTGRKYYLWMLIFKPVVWFFWLSISFLAHPDELVSNFPSWCGIDHEAQVVRFSPIQRAQSTSLLSCCGLYTLCALPQDHAEYQIMLLYNVRQRCDWK